MEYRVEHFSRTLLRDPLPFQQGRDAGWPIPDFDLPTTEGGRVRKSDFQGACPLLVTLACLTSPATASAAPVLRRLHRDYGERIAFLTVYVRESHPGEKIPQPSTSERKLGHADTYRRRDAIPWLVAVDDLEGSFHRAMGGGSGTAFLVDASGQVAFRTVWANDERPLRRAMAALTRGAARIPALPAHQKAVLPWLRSLVRLDDVVRAAGGDAVRDLRRQTPVLYAASELAWIWRTLTPLGRAALASAGALSAAGLLATLRLARHRH
jgi:hypothetical protein